MRRRCDAKRDVSRLRLRQIRAGEWRVPFFSRLGRDGRALFALTATDAGAFVAPGETPTPLSRKTLPHPSPAWIPLSPRGPQCSHISDRRADPSPACWGRWRHRASKDPRLSTGYGAGWGVARCYDARRLARTSPRTCGPSALLSTPHPPPSATPSPLREEGDARRPLAGSPSAPHRRSRRRRKSLKISRAALCPGAPLTPPPGWVEAPHI